MLIFLTAMLLYFVQSVECQKKDYRNHKKLCRQVGHVKNNTAQPTDTKPDVVMKGRRPPPAFFPFSTISGPIQADPQQAPDYSAWDRQLVLHADHRKYIPPMVHSLMGVYNPMKGRTRHGYPVWERCAKDTVVLIQSLSQHTKESLEQKGIGLQYKEDFNTSSSERQVLFVSREQGLQLLTVAREPKINNEEIRFLPLLAATHIPHDITSLLSVPSALFSTPDKSFSTWSGPLNGQMMFVDVAITPSVYFDEAVALSKIETSAPRQSSQKKKKKSNKKTKQQNDCE
jgi:hypothetical protein